MWYWRKQNFEGLKEISEYLSDSDKYKKYKDYIDNREKGLRAIAFKKLEEFIDETKSWEFDQLKEFVDWILWVKNGLPEILDLIPQPLNEKLIRPTIELWIEKEPQNPAPYRWSGRIEDLRMAIKLNSRDQIAIRKYCIEVISSLDYSTHELPYEYLGNKNDDLALIEEAIGYLKNYDDKEESGTYHSELYEFKKKIIE
jgi:hypothetical protein